MFSKITRSLLSSKAFSLSFLIFIISAQVCGQTQGKYQGLLWEITGKGLKKPSYLYGTMHVSNKVAFHLSDTFFIALKSCDMVALEINPETLLEDFLSSPYLKAYYASEGLYDENFYQNAFATGQPENDGLGALLSKESDFANYLLYRSEYRRENFEENTYLDMFIFQAGKKLNKKIFGLEDVNATLELSVKASLPDEESDDEEEYISYADRMDAYETVEDAYRKGDLDLLDSLGDKMYTKSYREYMLFYRNELMAKRMDSIMRAHTSLFTGVGAAHLPGEKGIIELLRNMGYKVRAVVHNDRLSSKMKDKIENTLYKVSYSPQYPEDSLFEVSIPGKLLSSSAMFSDPYSEFSAISSREYFCPEVVNGAYYSIIRVNTFGPLYGLSQEDLYQKIDSLLFENIPGKILKKKEIRENGNPGFDILSRTRRGDLNHYKILVTPLEILIFKLSGAKDFVSKESTKFINSAKLSQPDNAWRSYAPLQAGFSLSMPGKALTENNMENGGSRQLIIQSYQPENKDYYLFMKSVLHDHSYIEEDSFELDHLSKQFYDQFDFEVTGKKFFSLGNNPALDISLGKADKKLMVRIVISATNYYLLAYSSETGENWEKFSGSFAAYPPEYSMPFEEYVDSICLFKVTTPVKPVGHAFRKKELVELNSRKEKDEQYQYKKRTATFVCKAASEAVKVEYHKFHDFKSYESEDDLWESQLKKVSNDGKLVIARKVQPQPERMDLLLTDTNSTRAIKVSIIWKEGVVYRLYANIDTISGESRFVRTFFNSFTPLDSLGGISILANKPEKFFTAILGEDSLQAVQALNSIQVIRFRDEDAVRIIGLLEKYAFSKVLDNYSPVKERLIRELGYLKDPAIIPFLERQYKNSGDTSDYQIMVLKALGKLKTEESYKTITRLLKEEVPLTKISEVTSLFSLLQDSLRLSALLFPDLLEYTRYQEYKSPVYELLYMLADSGFVKPQVYASYKSQILREANEEVKRKAAAEISSATRDYDYPDYSYEYGYAKKRRADELEIYSALLVPFYDEPQVSSYFSKLSKIKDSDLNLRISLLLLKSNREVADSVWSKFTSNDGYRLALFKQLKTIGKLEKFDPVYHTQESICKALLYDNILTSGKDSVILLEKRMMIHRGKKGYVYFFKSKREDSKTWKIDYVGLQPADSNKVEIDEILVLRRGNDLPESELNEFIDEQVEEIGLIGRKRAEGYRSNTFLDYMDY